MKFTDFFLGIFLKNRIFLPRCSTKESCKKYINCALWIKSTKFGKKCISVCVIAKVNGNHFLPLLLNRSFLSEKWKIISTKCFLLYNLIHFHIESLLYFQKKSTIIRNFFFYNVREQFIFNTVYILTFYWVFARIIAFNGNGQNHEYVLNKKHLSKREVIGSFMMCKFLTWRFLKIWLFAISNSRFFQFHL